MTNTQIISNNLSNLTLLIPAKEETDCIYQVLTELQSFNFQKIIVIPTNTSLPSNWTFQNLKIINQSKNGYGNALLEGIKRVETKYFCIFIPLKYNAKIFFANLFYLHVQIGACQHQRQ